MASSGKIRVLIVDDVHEARDNVAKLLRFEPDVEIVGRMKPTGIRPKFMHRFEASNIYLPPNIFGVGDRLFS